MLIKTPPSNKNYRIEIGLRIWNNKTHHPKKNPAREARRNFFGPFWPFYKGKTVKNGHFGGPKS